MFEALELRGMSLMPRSDEEHQTGTPSTEPMSSATDPVSTDQGWFEVGVKMTGAVVCPEGTDANWSEPAHHDDLSVSYMMYWLRLKLRLSPKS